MTNDLNSNKHRENFLIELQKISMTMGDSLLLLENKFHFSYKQRLSNFNGLKPKSGIPTKLLCLITPYYKKAIKQKLNPEFIWEDNERMIKLWFEVRDILGLFFLWFESKRLNKKIDNWIDYYIYVSKNGLHEPIEIRIKNIIRQFTFKNVTETIFSKEKNII